MKKTIAIAAGVIGGYLIYYTVLMELAAIFFSVSDSTYLLINILLLIFSMAGCALILYFLLERKLCRPLYGLLTFCYFAILSVTLFCRMTFSYEFILNPLVSISELSDPEMLVESALNIILLIPAGHYLRKLPLKTALLTGFAFSFAIELIQGVTQRGFFDTFDIILYMAGIFIGRQLSRKFFHI